MGWKHKYCKRKENLLVGCKLDKRNGSGIPTIEVTKTVLDELSNYRQVDGVEQPGILLGSVIGLNHYRVNRASPPFPVNGSTWNGCTRDANLANEYIQEQYEESGHTRIYLGEWHTHPENKPAPSSTDIDSVVKVCLLPDCPPIVVLCIVGMSSNYWGCVVNDILLPIDIIIVDG